MTEHLPECPTDWCICSYLRACEQRVFRKARRAVLVAMSREQHPWNFIIHPTVTAINAIDELIEY